MYTIPKNTRNVSKKEEEVPCSDGTVNVDQTLPWVLVIIMV